MLNFTFLIFIWNAYLTQLSSFVKATAHDDARDHEICLPFRNSFSSRPPAPAGPQGRPGKLGPRGIPGASGQKGEPGVEEICTATSCYPNNFVVMTNEKFDILTGELADLRAKVAEIEDIQNEPDEGWIAPGNGYQYRFTTSSQSWRASRLLCQEMGGDLASYRLQSEKTRRRIIEQQVTFTGSWIGLKDDVEEGSWKWVNDPTQWTVTTSSDLWQITDPKQGTRANCAGWNPNSLLYDAPCNTSYRAVCEKLL